MFYERTLPFQFLVKKFSGTNFIKIKELHILDLIIITRNHFVLKTGQYSLFLDGVSGYDDDFKKNGDVHGPFDIQIPQIEWVFNIKD